MKINDKDCVSVLSKGTNVQNVIEDIANSNFQEDAFFVMDLGEVEKQFKTWKTNLPNIKPYYAVKCNDSNVVLRLLAALGSNFDCASKGEIAKVLSVGVSADRIIFANPTKQKSHIRYAAKVGVNVLTFDNPTELHKIKEIHPNARVVLRVLADSYDSQCPPMGLKFGATLEQSYALVKLALSLNLDLAGFSFHVGSGCREPTAFRRALLTVQKVREFALKLGFEPKIIDVGGGFTNENFDSAVLALLKGLSDFSNVEVIAEPGRFFVTTAYTLATRVHSMRKDESKIMYYINDGVYGSFNCLLFDKAVVNPIPLKKLYGPTINSDVWGPTCDSLDVVVTDCQLPILGLSDWLLFHNMGSYTIPTSTSFNGFDPPKIHHVANSVTWENLKNVVPDIFTYDEQPYWF